MTTLTLGYRAVHQKIRLLTLPSIPWKTWYILGVVCLGLMLVSYIYLINQLTGGSYLIKSYNQEMNVLLVENKTLETHFAKSDFLGNVQEKAGAMNFEKTTQIKYVQITPWSPALGMVK